MILKRRLSTGKIRYGVRVDRPGRKQEWIGTYATIAEARQANAKALLGRAPSRMTCDKFAEHWLEGYRDRVKGSSHDAAKSALKGFIEDFRGIPLNRLDRITAEQWARKNRWRVPVVVTVMNAAYDSELVHRNPFAGLSQKGEGRKRIVPLLVKDVDKLAESAGTHNATLRGLVLFLAYTGVRVGEAFALEWDDLDFDAMRVRVERRVYRGELDLPKSNKPRACVLTPPARDALYAVPQRDSLVFTNNGRRFSQTSFGWYWRAFSTVLPRKTTPHELRHFAAHHLYVRMGLPARVVAAQLGHNGPKLVEELYGHGDVGALEEIDRAFDNVIPLRKAQ